MEAIGKLEISEQRMKAEPDEACREAHDAAVRLGRVAEELGALRSRVANQEATIQGLTARKADRTRSAPHGCI